MKQEVDNTRMTAIEPPTTSSPTRGYCAGLDVHQKACDIALVNPEGTVVRRSAHQDLSPDARPVLSGAARDLREGSRRLRAGSLDRWESGLPAPPEARAGRPHGPPEEVGGDPQLGDQDRSERRGGARPPPPGSPLPRSLRPNRGDGGTAGMAEGPGRTDCEAHPGQAAGPRPSGPTSSPARGGEVLATSSGCKRFTG